MISATELLFILGMIMKLIEELCPVFELLLLHTSDWILWVTWLEEKLPDFVKVCIQMNQKNDPTNRK